MQPSNFHLNVLKSDIPAIKTLISQGVNLNAYDALGHTPLHWAVIGGNPKVVELLLKAGANPNILSLEGVTPTWRAVNLQDAVITEILAAYGGKVESSNPFVKSELKVICR